jgi:hypothetical protein
MASPLNTFAGYVPGPVEVWGRRLKMEYIGMASVFTVIAVLIYGGAPWASSLPATLGSFFLFLGLKKKNRDHIMCSFLLFGAALLARPAVVAGDWAIPLLLFGATVFSLERAIEKRPEQVYGLPVVMALWGWLDGLWLLGLAFAAGYLLDPLRDREDARRKLVLTVPAAAVAGGIATAARLLGADAAGYWPAARIPLPGAVQLAVALAIALVVVTLVAYWPKLLVAHRVGPILLGALAPWDLRATALFGMGAAVLLAATVFRQSIDSDRLRPFVKHAEWHFFYLVLAVALWAVLAR